MMQVRLLQSDRRINPPAAAMIRAESITIIAAAHPMMAVSNRPLATSLHRHAWDAARSDDLFHTEITNDGVRFRFPAILPLPLACFANCAIFKKIFSEVVK